MLVRNVKYVSRRLSEREIVFEWHARKNCDSLSDDRFQPLVHVDFYF